MNSFLIIISFVRLFVPCFSQIREESSFLIRSEFYCLTNSSSALTFNEPLSNTGWGFRNSNWFPSENFCDMEIIDSCARDWIDSEDWLIDSALNRGFSEIILDRRWEGFGVHKSEKFIKRRKKLLFQQIYHNLQGDVAISVSIKSQGEEHLFLCEGQVASSNCYWILLEGWGRNSSAIRKCLSGNIGDEDKVWPSEPCKTPKVRKDHFNNYIFSENEWRHFTIIKKQEKLAIHDDKGQVFLEFVDSEEPFFIKNLLIHSKTPSGGRWIFHDYNFLFTDKTTIVRFSNNLKIRKDKPLCLSFFLKACWNCYIEINEGTSFSFIIEPKINERWFENKLYIPANGQSRIANLYLKTYIKGYNVNPFWAIDTIRICDDSEYRYISTTERFISCSLLNSTSIKLDDIDGDYRDVSRCEAKTVGTFCVPIASSMGINRYCQVFNRELSCFCQRGYGSDCQSQGSVVLKHPPTVGYVGTSTAEITCYNFETLGKGTVDNYSFQYKSKYSDWKSFGDGKFGTKATVTLKDLEADTFYYVRIVLDDSNQGFEANFTTKCEDLSYDMFDIEPTNTSAKISFKIGKQTCGLSKVIAQVNNRNITVQEAIFVDRLEPFTDYRVYIRNAETFNVIASKPFRTSEGVPFEVSNLEVRNGSGQFLLSWSPPIKPNGLVQGYQVYGQLIQNRGCKERVFNPVSFSQIVKTTETTIEYIQEYSVYSLSIRAETKAGYGKELETIAFSSVSLDKTFKPPEYNLLVEKRTIMIDFKANCSALKGPIEIKIGVYCKSPWCSNLNTTSLNFDRIQIDNLIPYSKYLIHLLFCQRDSPCFEVSFADTTKPDTPNEVRNLTVFRNKDGMISLKWQPPYPPYGEIDVYEIRYKCHSCITYNSLFSLKVNPEPCKLWPGYSCTTLQDYHLYKDYALAFFVSVKNKNESFGLEKKLLFENYFKEPSPAYNVSTVWDNDEVTVYWSHPLVINADYIKCFEVGIKGNSTSYTFCSLCFSSFLEALPLYSCKQNITKFLKGTTDFSLNVLAYNDKISTPSLSESLEESSPPETVQFEFQEPPIAENDGSFIKLIIPSLTLIEDKSTKYIQVKSCLNQTSCRIIFETYQAKLPLNLTIGNGSQTFSEVYGTVLLNPELVPNVQYNISIILLNKYKGKIKFVEGWVNRSSISLSGGSSAAYIVIPIVLIGLLAAGYYLRRKIELFIPAVGFLGENLTEHEVKEELSLVIPNLKSNHEPKYSKRVILTNLEKYIKESIENGELERQHSLFPRGQTQAWDYGALPVNKPKNRYNNLFPYDHTRVKLEKTPDDPYSDYINANYIDGYECPRAYIATQGPKSSTLTDFWRMVWQENINTIVMLANLYESGKKKVEKYWPSINEEIEFDAIKVKHLESKVISNFEKRSFAVIKGKESRTLVQLHYTSWPDHGVPLYPQSLVPFLEVILKVPLSSRHPILVHCSAGVGRTGSIILCDICLRMAAAECAIDPLKYLEVIRSQRPNLVDNPEQYKLVHLVVLDFLLGLKTSIPCNESLEITVQKILETGIRKQMKYLESTDWQDSAMHSVAVPIQLPIVEEKNRFARILPENHCRVFLECSPPSDLSSSYINAVKVDGFCNPDRFIVTQHPLPNTVLDFWRMIIENNVKVVVCLNPIEEEKSCCQFWPEEKELILSRDFKLSHLETKQFDDYNLISMSLNESYTVEMIWCFAWEKGAVLPEDTEVMLRFWEESDALSRGSAPVVVTCYDGVTASGLFCALSFLIEKIKQEQECDVCLAVRSVRHSRREFIRSEEQFRFLYRAGVQFVNTFESYANFKELEKKESHYANVL